MGVSEQAEPASLFRLVKLFQAGQTGAFADLWRSCFRLVYSWCRYGREAALSVEECEDLCSEVMSKVYERLSETDIQNGLHFLRWLKMVTINRKTDYLRRAVRYQRAQGELADKARLQQTQPPEEAALSDERHSQLARALGALSAEEESLLQLHLHEGKTFPEIALMMEGMKAKAGKYKKRYYRVLEQLKKRLDEQAT